MATFDIVLAGNRRPQFPDMCVGCELEFPRSVAKISVVGASAISGWKMDAANLALGEAPIRSSNSKVRLEVPCCPKCGPALERRHFWKSILLYVSGFGGAAAAFAVIYKGKALGLPAAVVPYVGALAAVALVLLPVIWELKLPPAFTVTPTGGQVIYEFRSHRCAEAFLALNPGA